MLRDTSDLRNILYRYRKYRV